MAGPNSTEGNNEVDISARARAGDSSVHQQIVSRTLRQYAITRIHPSILKQRIPRNSRSDVGVTTASNSANIAPCLGGSTASEGAQSSGTTFTGDPHLLDDALTLQTQQTQGDHMAVVMKHSTVANTMFDALDIRSLGPAMLPDNNITIQGGEPVTPNPIETSLPCPGDKCTSHKSYHSNGHPSLTAQVVPSWNTLVRKAELTTPKSHLQLDDHDSLEHDGYALAPSSKGPPIILRNSAGIDLFPSLNANTSGHDQVKDRAQPVHERVRLKSGKVTKDASKPLPSAGKSDAVRKKGRPPKPIAQPETAGSSQTSNAIVERPLVFHQKPALHWTYVNRATRPDSSRETDLHPMKKIDLVGLKPHVWASSRTALRAIFPDLCKSTTGLSWLYSEMPMFLLDKLSADGCWNGGTAMDLSMTWDFVCDESDLEPVAEDVPSNQSLVPDDSIRLDDEDETSSLASFQYPPGSDDIRAPELHTVHSQSSSGQNFASLLSSELLLTKAEHIEVSSRLQGRCTSPQKSCSTVIQALDDPLSNNSTIIKERHPHITSDSQHHDVGMQSRLPHQMPPEMKMLAQAQIHQLPLVLIASRKFMPFDIPPKYAYSYLGLFFVADLRTESVHTSRDISPSGVKGQVRWTLSLEWAPGGEKALTGNNHSHPWWISPHADSSTLSRHRDLSGQYWNYLPLDLLASTNSGESFPRGWFCKVCGLLNAQKYFRHRICGNSDCQSLENLSIPRGYVEDLHTIREVHQYIPVLLPQNSAPDDVEVIVEKWEDGMSVYKYGLNEHAVAKHISTSNHDHLQGEPAQLLKAIQAYVQLSQESAGSPYFTHLTSTSPVDREEAVRWEEAPLCVAQARDLINDYVQVYDEAESFSIDTLLSKAWVRSGSDKGNLFKAKESCLVVLCLGSDVNLALKPKAGFWPKADINPAMESVGSSVGEPSHSMDNDEDGDNKQVEINVEDYLGGLVPSLIDADNLVSETAVGEIDVEPQEAPTTQQPLKPRWRGKPKPSEVVQQLSVKLVHGDALVLRGDDFEYQLIRTGTTILLVGSQNHMTSATSCDRSHLVPPEALDLELSYPDLEDVEMMDTD